MNTNNQKIVASRSSGTSLPFFTLLVFTCSTALLLAGEPEAVPKDHALFVGASLQVKQDGGLGEVDGVTDDTAWVVMNGQRKSVPLLSLEEVRIQRSLKLSDTIATIGNPHGEPIHTSDTNTARDWARQQIVMGALQTESMNRWDRSFQGIESASAVPASSLDFPMAQQRLAAATEVAGDSQRSMSMAQTFAQQGMGTGSGPNALAFSCEISSPRLFRNAFLLLVTEFHDSAKPDLLQYRIHTQALPELGPKMQRMHFTQKGFPGGYRLERCQTFLFGDGQELATNLSERRVDLTADDALRYLSLCYIASHAKESLSAVPLRVAFPSDFRKVAPEAAVARPLYVTVGTDGSVKNVVTAEGGTTAPDIYIDSVVRKFRFNPALNGGKPVESVLELKLSDYIR